VLRPIIFGAVEIFECSRDHALFRHRATPSVPKYRNEYNDLIAVGDVTGILSPAKAAGSTA
jgi:hypothetical protein